MDSDTNPTPAPAPEGVPWKLRGDDGQRPVCGRFEEVEGEGFPAMEVALQAMHAAFGGVDGARVEIWLKKQACGHYHLYGVEVWAQHGVGGDWERLTPMGYGAPRLLRIAVARPDMSVELPSLAPAPSTQGGAPN